MISTHRLKDIFGEALIRDIEECISRNTGLSFRLYDPSGAAVSEPEAGRICKSLPKKPGRCLYRDLTDPSFAPEGFFTFRCELGFVHLGLPILLEDNCAGWLIADNMALKVSSVKLPDRITETVMLSKSEYGEAFKAVRFSAEMLDKLIKNLLPKVVEKDKLEFLQEYSRLQDSSLSVGELAQLGLEKAVSLLAAARGIIYIRGERGAFEPLAVIGFDREKVMTKEIAIDPSLIRRVIGRGKAVILKEEVRKSFLTRVIHSELKDAICVPLKDKTGINGMILVSDSVAGRSYDTNDLNFLSLIASEIASELANARLTGALEKRLSEMSTIFKMSRFITSKFDADEIIDALMKMVTHLLPGAVFLLKTYDKKAGRFELTAFSGLNEEEAVPFNSRDTAAAVVRKVIRNGRPCTGQLPAGTFPDHPGIDRVTVLPLVVKDKLAGVLEVYLKPGMFLDDTEIELLTTLVNQASASIENSRLYKNLKVHFVKTVAALAGCVEAKDPYTKGHSVRVSAFSSATAEELGLTPEEIEDIQIAGILHDIGKIGISEKLLLKPGGFTDDEYSVVKQHPAASFKIVEPLGFSARIKDAVLYHHENLSGTGYPEGLRGKDIPIAARIIRVTDSWDAMTSNRPYRDAMNRDEATREIVKGINNQYDESVAKAFLKVINREDIVFETV